MGSARGRPCVVFFCSFVALHLAWPRGVAAAPSQVLRGQPAAAYRMGDVWGKSPVGREDLFGKDPVLARAALAVAEYGGGTAFYLGNFGGLHLMATNHHVQPTLRCDYEAQFPYLDQAFACSRVLVSEPGIDLALFAIEVDDDFAAYFKDIGHNFAFDAEVEAGQALLTLGYGIAENPRRALTAGQDADCVVFSASHRLMADPDEYNPGPYKTWSFAHACDISHGDSGSPLLDRRSGKVLGIVWTGAIPKSPAAQKSRTLRRWLEAEAPEIWTELNYGVPAGRIKERLLELLVDPGADLDDSGRAVLRAVLSGAEAGDRPAGGRG